MNEVIAYGRTAELLAYDNDHVLKLFRPGIPPHVIEEEFRISLSVYQCGVSIPQPVKIIDYSDRMGIIYQRVSGFTMLKTISKKPWSINKEAIRMARIHSDIHSKNVLDLPKQKEILKERIGHATILTMEEKERIINHLNGLMEDTKLCHGDFHPDNIILGNREWIIDWMTGMTGNPAGDVARTILLIQLGTMPDETPKIMVYLFSLIRKQILKRYIKQYLKNSAIDLKEIDDWMLPIAAARLTEWIPEKEKQEIVNLIRQRF
jgi:tRNA A-37 threonylcarbamoyl transferase component Bud32